MAEEDYWPAEDYLSDEKRKERLGSQVWRLMRVSRGFANCPELVGAAVAVSIVGWSLLLSIDLLSSVLSAWKSLCQLSPVRIPSAAVDGVATGAGRLVWAVRDHPQVHQEPPFPVGPSNQEASLGEEQPHVAASEVKPASIY
jgi:hypothetical protein